MTREGVGTGPDHLLHVITGLVPVIPMREAPSPSDRDGRHKAGHDVRRRPNGRKRATLVTRVVSWKNPMEMSTGGMTSDHGCAVRVQVQESTCAARSRLGSSAMKKSRIRSMSSGW